MNLLPADLPDRTTLAQTLHARPFQPLVAKGAPALGLPLNFDLCVGLSVPVLALLALGAVRRAHQHALEVSPIP